MGVEIRIEKEFRDKIPPLTDDEFKQLQENILEAGEVYEPIAVWNGVIVDGHNRYKIVQEHPEIKWRTREMDFPDKWAAFDWMYKNQLGRRNLTEQQRTYMIGKMYEARKKSVGAPSGNSNAGKQSDQIGHFEKPKTRKAVADELGVGEGTVQRAEKFAKGVDTLREVSPEAADKVLSGDAEVKKHEIMAIPQMEADEVKAVTESIIDNKPIQKPKKKNTGFSAADRELYRIINEANAELEDTNREDTFDLEDMIRLIKVNGQDYIVSLTRQLSTKRHLLNDDESKKRVFEAIAEIIQSIVKVRGEYTK